MKIFFGLVILALCGVLVFWKVEANGDPNNSFNQTTRFHLGRYSPMRLMLGLHQAGDARQYYLLGSQPISLEVVQARGSGISDQLVAKLVQDIESITGRNVILYNTELVQGGTLTDGDLDYISSGSRHHVVLGDPNLFMVYAQSFSGDDQAAGKTYQEYGIVLSQQRISQATAQYPEAFPQMVEAVFLHELGKQLGLPEKDGVNCVMSPGVENPYPIHGAWDLNAPTSFCVAEKNQLEAMVASYNQ